MSILQTDAEEMAQPSCVSHTALHPALQCQRPVHEDLPVVIFQLNVVTGLQDLPIPQPRDLGGGFPLGHTREDGGSPHGPGNGLGMLHKLCRGCKEEGEAG